MAALKPASFAISLSLAFMLGGCMIAKPLSAAEEEVKSDLDVSNYYPATREMRNNIETQPLFAQAAFWGREYDLNPSDLESAIKLSSAVRKLGNAQRAIEIAQTTRALYPRDPYLAAEFAAALIASERALDAMAPLDEALRVAPNYARLWSLKGAALDQTERYELARKHYDRALRITPNDPNILANLGLSYALSGDPVTAEKWLQRASALPGAGPGVHQNLALVLQLQGKTEQADKLARLSRGDQRLPPPPVPAHQTAPLQAQGSQNFRPQNFGAQNFGAQNFGAQNFGTQGFGRQAPTQQNAANARQPLRRSIQPPAQRPNRQAASSQAASSQARLAPSDDLSTEQRQLLNQIAGNLRPQKVPQQQINSRARANNTVPQRGYPQQGYQPQSNGQQGYARQNIPTQDYAPNIQTRPAQQNVTQTASQSPRGAARIRR